MPHQRMPVERQQQLICAHPRRLPRRQHNRGNSRARIIHGVTPLAALRLARPHLMGGLESQPMVDRNRWRILGKDIEDHIAAAAPQQMGDNRRCHATSVALPARIWMGEDTADDGDTILFHDDVRSRNRDQPPIHAQTVIAALRQ